MPFAQDDARRRHLEQIASVTGDAALQGCLTSPGMGDQKASSVVHAYNKYVLLLRGRALDESCWMSYGCPAPAGRLSVDSYIFDILVLMIAEATADGKPLRDLDRAPVQAIRDAHCAAGTCLHEGQRQERLLEAAIPGFPPGPGVRALVQVPFRSGQGL